MRTRTTAILNMKGGVAKTTTVLNMAAILAERGHKVLVIDGDSQCNTTDFLGSPVGCRTLASLLRGEIDDRPEVVQSTIPGVDLLPADDSLMDLDLTKAEAGRVHIGCLKDRIRLEWGSVYDYALIDCPPAFSAATAAALIAADDAIIPMKLDAFSVRGMANLFRQIENMRRINPQLTVAGILPTMWYRSTQMEETERQLLRAGLPVFHHIRRSNTVDRMTFEQAPLQTFSKNSAALRDYRIFVGDYQRQAEGRR